MEPESISDMLDVFERQRNAGSPFRSPSDSVHPTPYRRHLFDGPQPSPLGHLRQTPVGLSMPGFTPMRKRAPPSGPGLQDVLSMASPSSYMVAQTADNAGPMLASQAMLWDGDDDGATGLGQLGTLGGALGSHQLNELDPSHWASPAKPVDVRLGHVFNLSSPAPAPTPSSSKRTLDGVGMGTPSRVVRTAKKIRAATADMNGAPLSPTRRRTDAAAPHGASLFHRSVSANLLVPQVPPIGRTVSNSSFMSTSSVDLLSPHLGAYPEGVAMPMLDSAVPSPNLSHHSPLGTPQMGNVIFTSPEQAQGGFTPDFASFAGAGHMMSSQPTGMPMTLSHSQPLPHSQPTYFSLGTISETPDLVQDEVNEMPAPLPVQGAFQLVDYPAVPGLTYAPPDFSFQPVAPVNAHPSHPHPPPMQHSQSYMHAPPVSAPAYPGLGFGAPPHARTISGPVPHAPSFTYEMQPAHDGMYPVSRSASAPAPISFMASMPSMAMPQSTSVNGLYGPGPLPPPPPPPPMYGAPSHVPFSPDTPRKRQASKRFGNYNTPGPTPKPTAGASSPMPGDDRPGPSDAEPSSAPSSDAATAPRLQVGPSLDEFRAQIQHTQRGTIILPATAQPVLTLQPARRADDAANPSTLPKTFIESLYSTFSEYNPQTGQTAKRFRCMIEGCERSFPRKSAIHSHIQTHLEDKPFVCDKDPNCAAAFVRQHDLRRHQRIHTGEKTHNCECGKIFARGDALHRHKLRNICVGGSAFGRPMMM